MDTANLKELVFVKLLLPYLVGSMLGIWLELSALLWPMGLALLLLSGLLFAAHQKNRALVARYSRQWAIILFGWLIYAGLLNSTWANPTLSPQHYSHSVHIPGVALLQIDDVPQKKTNSYQVVAQVIGSYKNEKATPQSGKVMLQLPLDSLSANLSYGQIIAVNARFEPIPPPQNPYEFHYANYLANKHIHHQLRPKANRWYHTGQNSGSWFYTHIFKIRNHALNILSTHLTELELYGVASAMLLGYRGALAPEVRQRYTVTGSMHVLAVSGMHVGYLFIILGWVLLPLQYFKFPWLRLTVLLVIIWLYAALTGLSPSVLRASVMFSLFAMGNTLTRQANSVNLLAASALLILLWEPRQLLDVGFQLSYLAVLGIIFIYKPLVNIWPIKHSIARFFWQGTCISIAAQVATFPLVLYYFHQAPLYALLANLGMLLLAPWVMITGLAVLVINWVPGLGWLIGQALWLGLWLMDETLVFISSLPHAAWKAIYPTLLEVMLLFAMLITGIAALYARPVKPLMVACCLLLLFLGIINYRLYEQKLQQGLVVYQFADQTVMAALNGQQANLWIDSLALADTARMERSIYPYLHAHGCETPTVNTIEPPKTNSYRMVGGQRIALLTNYKRRNLPKERLKVDYLVMAHNPSVDIQQLQWVYDARYIIFDGSNNAATVERRMKECKVLGLDCHSTRNGAFIASW